MLRYDIAQVTDEEGIVGILQFDQKKNKFINFNFFIVVWNYLLNWARGQQNFL